MSTDTYPVLGSSPTMMLPSPLMMYNKVSPPLNHYFEAATVDGGDLYIRKSCSLSLQSYLTISACPQYLAPFPPHTGLVLHARCHSGLVPCIKGMKEPEDTEQERRVVLRRICCLVATSSNIGDG